MTTNEVVNATSWFEDSSNIARLARWMADNGYTAHDIAYFIGKPWKYADEFEAMNRPPCGYRWNARQRAITGTSVCGEPVSDLFHLQQTGAPLAHRFTIDAEHQTAREASEGLMSDLLDEDGNR
jgi:hypothetical protein